MVLDDVQLLFSEFLSS